MANIFPFKGILYNKERVWDFALVTAPPYDVISEKEQDQYYKIDEHNIIRLILGKENPEDGPEDNRYTRAASFLKKWLNEKVLVEGKNNCIYFYSQEYELGEVRKIQKGFICILRLEEFSENGGVLPHEETLRKPKEDRLRLMSACHANLSPIFGLYSDPNFHLETLFKENMDKPPSINVKDADGILHRLWRVHNSDTIRIIQTLLHPKKIYIADGHHRYETAISYRENRRKIEGGFTGEELYNHIMIYLTNMDDDGLTILPAHRLVRSLPSSKPARQTTGGECSTVREGKLNEFFIRRSCSSYEEMSKLMKDSIGRENAFGMYNGKRLEFLVLRDSKKRDEVMGSGIPDIYKSLDVVVAHNLLLDHILNNGRKMLEDNITYVKDEKQAMKLVDEGKFELAVLLNPTKVEQVKAIASIGGKMPGKATYFYPKPLSGLVINKLSSNPVLS